MCAKISSGLLTVEAKTAGGSLTSIKDANGTEYLWQGDPAYWTGQAPNCFPMCGGLRDGKAVIGGNMITEMPRHGIAKNAEFVQDKTTDTSVKFVLRPDAEMLKAYPYRFQFAVTYTVDEKTLTVTYDVTNEDTKPMPYCVGGHLAFNCPISEGESYDDYVVEFEKEETIDVPAAVPSTGLIDMETRTPFLNHEKIVPLSHEMFSFSETIIDHLESRVVTLHHKTLHKGVQISFADFPYLILWSTKNGAPFVAIEPWAGLSTCSDESDVFEEKRNVVTLQPGESRHCSFSVTIL